MSRPPLLLALVTAVSCGGDAVPDRVTADEPIPVTVVTVGSRDLTAPVVATGVLAGRDEVGLSFKVGGVVDSVPAEAGDRVVGGRLLARLSPEEVQAVVRKAELVFERARRDAERARRLSRDSITATAQREDAETMLGLAEQDLRAARFNATYAEVRAPSDGIVLRRLVSPGTIVGPGTPIVLFRPSGTGVLLRAGLSDRDAGRVSAGDRATVRLDAAPNRAFSGTVTRIAAGANPLSGTFDAEIALEGAARALASGLVGRAEIRPTRRLSRLALPASALIEADGDSARVFVLDSAGSVVRTRRIRIGTVGVGAVPVLGGLSAGERVVVGGAAYVIDGGRVVVRPNTPTGDGRTP